MSTNPKILQNTAKRTLLAPAIKDIHVNAEELIQRSVEEYENDLRLQANLLAKSDELVLSSHVKTALQIMQKEKAKKWLSEILILIGGAFLGAGIAGYMNEIAMSTLRPFWISVYVIMGILGLVMIFIAYIIQYIRL